MEPWAVELQGGHSDAAWDAFLHRYRRVIFAGIRHYVRDYDDVMDVFARVCELLRENDLQRLRAFLAKPDQRAKVSTWLVVVVRNAAIDWLRHRDGRRRLGVLPGRLAPLQREIFHRVFVEQRSHIEAYELIRARDGSGLPFGQFLVELRAVYQAVTEHSRGALPRELFVTPPETEGEQVDLEALETAQLLQRVMETLSPDDRVAVALYVVDGSSAEAVSRVLGWSVKTVYNRVYRALAQVREHLQAAGLTREDL